MSCNGLPCERDGLQQLLACGRSARPAADSARPWPCRPRSKSRTFSESSSARMRALMAGWVRRSAAAARETRRSTDGQERFDLRDLHARPFRITRSDKTKFYPGDKNNNVDLLSKQPQPECNGTSRAARQHRRRGRCNDV
jgi:hypothetical protein